MKYSNIFFLLLVFSSFVSAQKTEQSIYFKNGNIIHGEIVVQKSNEFIIMRNHFNDTLIYSINEIDSIKETNLPKYEQQFITFKKKGYYNQTSFGKLIDYSGNSYWGYSPTYIINSFTSINGIKYENYYVGIGVGIEIQNELIFPLFIELKYILDRGKINPIFFFQSGYMLPHKFHYEPYDGATIDYFGGIMFNPGIGIQFALNDKTAWYLAAEYRHQKLKRIETYPNSSPTEIKDFINRAVIRLGIQFY